MKKLLATLLASTMALTAIGGLVACGGDDGNGGGQEAGLKPSEFSQVTHLDDPLLDKEGENDDKVAACTLTVWVPSIGLKTYQALADKFTKEYRNGKYSNVEIEFDTKDEGNVKTELGTDATGGADVFFYASDHTDEMIRNNYLLPLRGATGSYYSAAIAQRDDPESVNQVSKNGYAYAFPASNANGYYLVYNKTLLSETEADSWDTILATAATSNKTVYWNYGEGFWAPIFFFGAGISPEWKGVNTNFSEFGGAKGEIGAKATIKYVTNSKITNKAGTGISASIIAGSMLAGICGTWENPTPEQLATGTIGCKKLPKFTVDGQDYQTGAFYGGKYCGVNANSKNKAVAMALANYLTNSAAQELRFDNDQTGPSNKTVDNMQKVKDYVPLQAYRTQAALPESVLQGDVPQSFWDGMGTYTGDAYTGETVNLTDLGLANLVTALTTAAN